MYAAKALMAANRVRGREVRGRVMERVRVEGRGGNHMNGEPLGDLGEIAIEPGRVGRYRDRRQHGIPRAGGANAVDPRSFRRLVVDLVGQFIDARRQATALQPAQLGPAHRPPRGGALDGDPVDQFLAKAKRRGNDRSVEGELAHASQELRPGGPREGQVRPPA